MAVKILLLVLAFFSAVNGKSLKATARNSHIQTFFPKSTFQTFKDGIGHPLSRRDSSLEDAAVSFVQSQLQINSSSVSFKSGYSSDVTEHAYVNQQHNDIPFANAVANVAFKDDKVVSFGHSFINPSSIASSTPSISQEIAISAAEQGLNGAYNQIPVILEYLAQPDNTAALVYVVQVHNPAKSEHFAAYVDAHSGQFISAIDFVANAAYRVLPIYKQNVTQGFELLVDPQDLFSSPLGWHNNGEFTSNDTSGNNVVTFYDQTSTNTTVQSAPGLVFNYTQDPDISPTFGMNPDAARTNVFYIINTMHDITYRYGFTEAAFNFQETNIQNNGGVAGDRVMVMVQNSESIDNAAFNTPPDGQSGLMFMFLWDLTNPERDGAVENDIVSHEMTHGVTNRLVGGGTARCLQIVDWTEQTSVPIVDFTLGTYVQGGPEIRSHPYSTNMTTNPLTYTDLLEEVEVHGIGEVWANMLHNVHAALVDAHGFSSTAHTDPTGTEGNVVWLHLFIDSLPLLPCQPDFLQARDGWIQADQNRYDGANFCLLWGVFASRGLGFSAVDYTNDFTVPSECSS